MTARIVLVSALHHARATPRFHAENPLIPGSATCGTPLRRPHRAIAVDDERLCGMCFGDVANEVAS